MRSSVFVGSSTEGLEIARALQAELDLDAEVEVWSQGAFGLSEGTPASLVGALDRFDFAVLVLSADDMVLSRGEERLAPRDNVLFELGLFMGGLGVDRTFILYDRSNKPSLPSDLAGVTSATFKRHSSGNLQASIGAPATQIRTIASKLGPRPKKAGRALQQATESLDETTAHVAQLSKTMARSRITELEITLRTFAQVLGTDMVKRIEADIEELRDAT